MIRKKKLYSRPMKPFESSRIEKENRILSKYGLKNKKEIWKALAKVNYFRSRAKALASAPLDEQEVFFKKLQALGLKAGSIADVLDLKVENLLDRRLPTIVARKKIAETPKQARQMVVHKKILVNGNVMNSPGYIVRISEENSISLKNSDKIQKSNQLSVSEEKEESLNA